MSRFFIYLALLYVLVLAKQPSSSNNGIINPTLGIYGYPDCIQTNPSIDINNVEANERTLACMQRKGTSANALKIACVGDSITAGSHASNVSMSYPSRLQDLLDVSKYVVTNLGISGGALQRNSDKPYWNQTVYQTLISNTWDIVIIMLGTNDAKDKIDGGADNWKNNDGCSDKNNVTLNNCTFADDYASMISIVRTLGTTPSIPPLIYLAIPPPLMEHGVIGANQTIINTIYPILIPMIAQKNNIPTVPISIFSAMGGVPNWQELFPSSCQLTSPWPACKYFCDTQDCDQCHPNDVGYLHLAESMKAGIQL